MHCRRSSLRSRDLSDEELLVVDRGSRKRLSVENPKVLPVFVATPAVRLSKDAKGMVLIIDGYAVQSEFTVTGADNFEMEKDTLIVAARAENIPMPMMVFVQ